MWSDHCFRSATSLIHPRQDCQPVFPRIHSHGAVFVHQVVRPYTNRSSPRTAKTDWPTPSSDPAILSMIKLGIVSNNEITVVNLGLFRAAPTGSGGRFRVLVSLLELGILDHGPGRVVRPDFLTPPARFTRSTSSCCQLRARDVLVARAGRESAVEASIGSAQALAQGRRPPSMTKVLPHRSTWAAKLWKMRSRGPIHAAADTICASRESESAPTGCHGRLLSQGRTTTLRSVREPGGCAAVLDLSPGMLNKPRSSPRFAYQGSAIPFSWRKMQSASLSSTSSGRSFSGVSASRSKPRPNQASISRSISESTSSIILPPFPASEVETSATDQHLAGHVVRQGRAEEQDC